MRFIFIIVNAFIVVVQATTLWWLFTLLMFSVYSHSSVNITVSNIAPSNTVQQRVQIKSPAELIEQVDSLFDDRSMSPSRLISELDFLMQYASQQGWQNEYLYAASYKLNTLVYNEDVNEAKVLYEEVKYLAEKLNDTEIAIQATIDYLQIRSLSVDYSGLLPILDELIQEADRLEDKALVADIYSAVGHTQREMEDYADAFQSHRKAFEYYEATNEIADMAHAMTALGLLSTDTNETDLALEYYEESLRLHRLNEDQMSVSVVLYNMAMAHQKSGEFRSAKKALEQSLSLSLELEDTVGIAYTQQALAELLIENERWDKALPALEAAQQFFKEAGNVRQQFASLLSIIDSHIALNNVEMASQNLQEAELLSENINSNLDMVDFNYTKAALKYALGDYQAAYDVLYNNIDVERVYFEKMQDESLLNAKVKFDTELQENKNKMLQQENELKSLRISQQEEQKKVWLIVLLLGLTLLVFVVVLLYIQTKNRDRFKKLALKDHLTNSPNRRAILSFAESTFEHSTLTGETFSICLIDLDFFKKLNDQYGHDIGDEVLVQFAECCRQSIRQQDGFGRYGGEEWLLVLLTTEQKQIEKVFKRIRKALNQQKIKGLSNDCEITFSMGVSCFEKNKTLTAMIKQADDKLYEAKSQDRDQIVF